MLDRMIKYTNLIVVKMIDSTKQIVEVFGKDIHKLHGLLTVIINNRVLKSVSMFSLHNDM